jgi:hypothetical protein
MAVAAQVGRSWCLDVNYFHALNLDLPKASQVPRRRQPEVFTPLDRHALWTHALSQQNWPTVE